MGNQATHGLRQEVINEIEAKTPLTADQIRRLYRDFSTLSPRTSLSRHVSLESLTTLYGQSFTGHTDGFVRILFDVMDEDKNGQVDFKEFVTSCVQLHGTDQQKLAWLFTLYDVDRQGYIYSENLTRVVQAILDLLSTNMFGEKKTADDIAREILDKVDKNHDNRISTSEFVEGASSCATLWRLLEVSADAARKPFTIQSEHRPRYAGRTRTATSSSRAGQERKTSVVRRERAQTR